MAGKRGQYTAYDHDQVAKWKQAEAANRLQQRQRRGRRSPKDASIDVRPGMLRVVTARSDADGHHPGDDAGPPPAAT